MSTPAERLGRALGAALNTRRLQISGRELAIAWVITAVVGAVWISSAKTPVARDVGPIVAMLAYLIFGLTRPIRNTTRLADSLYFLGFLWTLYALIVHLLITRQVRADDVFAVFGYALVTTAAGMFLRLVLIQFQRTVPDQFIEAREEIDARVIAFGEQLKSAEVAAARFSEQTLHSLESALTDMASNNRALHSEAQAAHARTLEEVSATLRQAVQGLADGLTSIQATVTNLTEHTTSLVQEIETSTKGISAGVVRVKTTLDRRIDAFDETLANVVQRLHALDIPADLVSGSVHAVRQELTRQGTELVAAFERLRVEIQRHVADVGRSIASSGATEELQRALATWRDAIGSVTEKCRELGEATAIVTASARTATSATDALKSAAADLRTDVVAAATRHTAAADAVVGELRTSADRVHTAVEDAVRFLSEHVVDGRR